LTSIIISPNEVEKDYQHKAQLFLCLSIEYENCRYNCKIKLYFWGICDIIVAEGADNMLVEFNVTNFRSLKEKNTISLLAGTDTSHESDLIAADNTRRLLPVAVIYGANSAGKSNILLAMQTMQSMITGENAQLLKDKPLPFEPFAFDKDTKASPTEYGMIFFYDGIKYAYSFSHNEKEILSEDLYHWPRGREALIFSRENDNYTFRDNEKEQTVLAKRTPANRLYLVSSNEWNAPQTEQAYKWFTEKLLPYDDQNTPEVTNRLWDENSDLSTSVLVELQNADLGIVGIDTVKQGEGEQKKTFVRMIHETEIDGKRHKHELAYAHESKGTQRFFSRIGPWIQSLEKGGILFIDELEASMHPLLTRRLVEMMQNPEINKNHAQLVFTTHDTMLLDLSLLRRDQIWFADKDSKTLATELFSLWDFSVRKDENILKGYLQGRYGAIPFLGGEV
jgi:AAA15 family ATPase/GTPase